MGCSTSSCLSAICNRLSAQPYYWLLEGVIQRPQSFSFQCWNTSCFNTYSQFWNHIITGVIAIITPGVLKTIGLEKNPSSPQAFLECFLHCMARSNCTIPSVSTSLSDFPALHRTWLSSLKIKLKKKKSDPLYSVLFCSVVESDSRLSGLHCSKTTFASSMQIKGISWIEQGFHLTLTWQKHLYDYNVTDLVASSVNHSF